MYLDKTGYLPLNQIRTDFRKENVSKPDTSFKGTPETSPGDEGQKVKAENIKAYYGITVSKNFETEKKADEILNEIKKEMGAKYTEENCPNDVKAVEIGNITTQGQFYYSLYKTIESLRKDNPEVFVYLGTEIGTPWMLKKMADVYSGGITTPVEILKEMSLDELKESVDEINKIYEYKPELDEYDEAQGFKPSFYDYINMLILKKCNPDVYDYISKSEDLNIRLAFWGISDEIYKAPSVDMFTNITRAQTDLMQKGTNIQGEMDTRGLVSSYIDDSNEFYKNKENVKKLSEEFSKSTFKEDVDLYRGDQTVGMFDTISIDKEFEEQARQLLEKNKENAKKLRVSSYHGCYGVSPNTNLYDLLNSKETLSLADAMQVARFGDDNFINEVIKKIQESKVTDTRFKSFSINKGFAEGWSYMHAGDNAKLFQKTTVKQGTEGGYVGGDNNQYEVILNNTPKEFTFQKVVYNKEENRFELESTVQKVNQ